MDIKTLVSFNVIKDDIEFIFSMPATAGLGTAYDAAHEILSKIVEHAKEVADKQKRKEEKKKEKTA